jgi:hypothetical protein
MRLAFYAPLKAPDHPVPSGDRAMARAIRAALSAIGADVILASGLRTRDGMGERETQRTMIGKAELEVARLIPEGRTSGWQAWMTYHNYYKAPDLIGPRVADALGIPYLLIEATRARSRLNGPWADFALRAEAATNAADVVFYFTEQDAEALHRDAPSGQILMHLRPFLNQTALPDASPLTGPMLSVGMMRHGDKLDSYRIIALTVARLDVPDWHLNIAGDGPARDAVTGMMAPFGDKVRFLGKLAEDEMAQAYHDASLLFWPGVNEAFGLAYLEAQAAGLPVVAQDRPGVRDVLAPGVYPAPDHGADALADRLGTLLGSQDLRAAAGETARRHVVEHHLLPAASATLSAGLAACGIRP